MNNEIIEQVRRIGLRTVAEGANIPYHTLRRTVNGISTGRTIADMLSAYLSILGVACGPLDIHGGQRTAIYRWRGMEARCTLSPGLRYEALVTVWRNGIELDQRVVRVPTMAHLRDSARQIMGAL